MQVIEAQCLLVLAPHDHLPIKQKRTSIGGAHACSRVDCPVRSLQMKPRRSTTLTAHNQAAPRAFSWHFSITECDAVYRVRPLTLYGVAGLGSRRAGFNAAPEGNG